MATPGAPLITILPDTHTGTNLSDFLNNWKLYLAATRRGTVRPTEMREGGIWFRDLAGSRAMMIVVQDNISGTLAPDGTYLSDRVLFEFEEPAAGGGQAPLGIEVFVAAEGSPPADPAQGDLWLIPAGVSEGTEDALTNWRMRLYDSGAWVEVVAKYNANVVVSDSLGVEPSGGTTTKYYGMFWMDALKDATAPTSNNGLKVWNGIEYVAAWPVIDGETMVKTTVSGVDPGPATPTLGLAHVNNVDDRFWVATGTKWLDLTEILTFVSTSSQVTNPVSTDLVMSPFWTNAQIEDYRSKNTISAFNATRWGDIVETLDSGANVGKVSSTLTVSTGLGYQSLWTATGGTEYPASPNVGDYYIIANDPSYTFTGGDLIGQTAYLGNGIIYNSFGAWELIAVTLNSDLFVHRDGSLGMYAPLRCASPTDTLPMFLSYDELRFDDTLTNFRIGPDLLGSEGVTILGSGKVGINTATPIGQLEVLSTGTCVDVRQDGSPGDRFGYSMRDSSSNASGLAWVSGIPQLVMRNGSGVISTRLSSVGASYLLGGNVGIGTSTPGESFHSAGISRLYDNRLNAGYAGIGYYATGDRNAQVTLFSDDTNAYGLRLIRLAGVNGGTTLSTKGTGTFSIAAEEAATLDFKTDNTARVTILSSSGNVGIGTATPTEKLEVDGDVILRRILPNGTANNLLSGEWSGESISTAVNNVLIGSQAGRYLTTGTYNIAIGGGAFQGLLLGTPVTGEGNVCIGVSSGALMKDGDLNVCLGQSTGLKCEGDANLAAGSGAYGGGILTKTGDSNVCLGHQAGITLESGSRNVCLGQGAEVPTSTANDQLSIMNLIYAVGGNVGIGDSTPGYKLEVAGTFHATGDITSAGACCSSDIRLKNIDSKITDASTLLDTIAGYRFHWKDSDRADMGVLAQDVIQVAPELVRQGEKDGILRVNYNGLVAMLIEANRELASRVSALESAR